MTICRPCWSVWRWTFPVLAGLSDDGPFSSLLVWLTMTLSHPCWSVCLFSSLLVWLTMALLSSLRSEWWWPFLVLAGLTDGGPFSSLLVSMTMTIFFVLAGLTDLSSLLVCLTMALSRPCRSEKRWPFCRPFKVDRPAMPLMPLSLVGGRWWHYSGVLLPCRQGRECSAHWRKVRHWNVWRRPRAWKNYRDVFLSHSCTINLLPSVNESSPKKMILNCRIERAVFIVCACWLANCSRSLKSRRHAN